MGTRALFEKLRQILRRFSAAEGGNVVITFTLSLIPILGLVGAAVDYSRGNSAKVAMQMAIDATGLMLSKDAQSLNTTQMSAKANDYFKALLNRSEIYNVVVTPVLSSPTEGSFKLDVTATGTVDTTFSKVIGKDYLDLTVNTEVRWGMKRLELALALDNTGSMASNNKMTELKKAAKSLLDTLKTAAGKAGDVKISIIPFDTTVKIGTSFKNEDWIDWTEAYGSCNKSLSDPKTKARCVSAGGTWTQSNNKNNWGGCVIDRDQDNDVLDTPPDGTTATKFPATSQCGNIAQALPLTDIWGSGYTTLKNKIDEMQPDGNTNVTIGLAWGWHSLTPNLPFSEGSAPKPGELDKVIILLTDGDNTQNRWSTNSTTIDNRTKAACANVKAANIKLYTVRVINGNATLLKNCATKPEWYYDVQNASQLNSVFTTIAKDLANLRIAK